MESVNLTAFEQATCEQLVSYKTTTISGETAEQLQERINKQVMSPKLVNEAKGLVANWNKQREEMGVAIWV
jgi:hypothetical protein